MRLVISSVVVAALAWTSEAFLPTKTPLPTRGRGALSAVRHDVNMDLKGSQPWSVALKQQVGRLAIGLALLGTAATPMESAWAISGGGKDYAEAKINGMDFSGQDLNGKDFSGAVAQNTKWVKSNLRGARFYKANLKDADFTGADLSGASFENASLDRASFRDAVMEGTYQSTSIEQAGDILNADFSDSLIRPDVQGRLCSRVDASGVNPKTKVATRDSLMCE